MMKYMVKITIKNISNTELAWKLTEIIYNEKLSLKNILKTINKPKNYKKLLNTLKDLSQNNKTIKKLYEYVKKHKHTINTKSKTKLENLQKTMLLSYFYDNELQKLLINEKPIAVILDNYRVHHAIVFTKLCNILNMDLIYLPPYSPKYNPIEQVWRTIKARVSRIPIETKENLIKHFKQGFDEEKNKFSYVKNWIKDILLYDV